MKKDKRILKKITLARKGQSKKSKYYRIPEIVINSPESAEEKVMSLVFYMTLDGKEKAGIWPPQRDILETWEKEANLTLADGLLEFAEWRANQQQEPQQPLWVPLVMDDV